MQERWFLFFLCNQLYMNIMCCTVVLERSDEQIAWVVKSLRLFKKERVVITTTTINY
ncbi:MAG: hypothetical protein H6Q17_2383 [Bacteroidetes bacterium]|nr:hypothetical protein [Bacteroidota bacterium]